MLNVDGIGMTSRRTRERLVRRLERKGIRDRRVLEAMREVPRHLFVDEALASRAYEDTALPIGVGQTISQPYVVARMTEVLLETGPLSRVLEIGTGCGYQAAVLAHCAERVYTVERIGALVFQTRERLHRLRIGNVRVQHADGRIGWPEHAPFDAILIAAAAHDVPDELVGQLAPGARLVAPLGEPAHQVLTAMTRTDDGVRREALEGVVFVPMLGGTRD